MNRRGRTLRHRRRYLAPAAWRALEGAGAEAAEAAPGPKPIAGTGGRKRWRPAVDVDDCLYRARKRQRRAKGAAAAASKADARNEMRCKQRVEKEALALSLGDMERITVLKRRGLRVDVEDDVLARSVRADANCASAAASAPR